MNYAEIKPFDIANAPKVSCTIFFSGCTHKCKGCFNEIAQDFNYGKEFDDNTIDYFITLAKNPQVKNICVLGGEPFQQNLKTMKYFFKRLKEETNKPIWVWSGYVLEELIQDKKKIEILKYVDVLIDGQFQIDKKDLNLRFRGSSNQRVIDVKESFKNNKIVLWEK